MLSGDYSLWINREYSLIPIFSSTKIFTLWYLACHIHEQVAPPCRRSFRDSRQFSVVWRALILSLSENSKSKLTSPLSTQSPIFFVEFRISQPEDGLGVVGQMKY